MNVAVALLLRLTLSLHVLAAVYWVGVGLFDMLILGPAMRSFAGRPWLSELLEWMRPRLRATTWLSLGVLLASGIANLVLLRLPLLERDFLRSGRGVTLLLKLGVVAIIVVLVVIHNFVQVPAIRALRLRGDAAPEAERAALREAYRAARRRAALVGDLTVALAVVAVVLGVWLTLGG